MPVIITPLMNQSIAFTLLQEVYPVELFVLGVVFFAVLGLLYRLGFSTNLGLLTAGIVAGSLEINFLMHEEVMHGLAELGALFLLFVTSARCRYRLVATGTSGMMFAAIYVGLATASAALLLRYIGLAWPESIFSALLLAFTCTPITIKLLSSSRAITQSSAGFDRTMLMQVLIVLIVLPLVPLMGDRTVPSIEVVRMYLVGLPLIGIAFVLAGGWFPETVDEIQRENVEEAALIKICTILGLPLLVTYVVGLPLAFGAVTSGVLISETRFRGRPVGDIVSLRWMMVALFMVPLGILFDYRILLDEIAFIGGMVTGMLVLKTVFLVTAAVIIQRNWRKRFRLNVHLLPIGGLSFLIFAEGRSHGLMPGGWEAGGEQLFITVTVLLFVVYGLVTTMTASVSRGSSPVEPVSDDEAPEGGWLLRGYNQMREGSRLSTGDRRGVIRHDDDRLGLRLSGGEGLVPVQARGLRIFLWDIPVQENAPIVDFTVAELNQHHRFNLILLCIWRTDICYPNPPPSLRLQAGDRLIVSGTPGEYVDGGKLFSSPEGSGADDWASPFDH